MTHDLFMECKKSVINKVVNVGKIENYNGDSSIN